MHDHDNMPRLNFELLFVDYWCTIVARTDVGGKLNDLVMFCCCRVSHDCMIITTKQWEIS